MYTRLISIIVLIGVTVSYAAILVGAQLREYHVGGVTGSAYSDGCTIFGWPTIYRVQYTRYALPTFRIDESADDWSPAHISINAAVILALICSVAVSTWRVIRFCRHKRTVSIAFMLAVITSIGAAFALNNGLGFLAQLQLNKGEWSTPYEMSSTLRVSVWIGLFCLAYCAIVIAYQCVRSVQRKRAA